MPQRFSCDRYNTAEMSQSAESLKCSYKLLEQQLVAANLLLKSFESAAAVSGGSSSLQHTSHSSGVYNFQSSATSAHGTVPNRPACTTPGTQPQTSQLHPVARTSPATSSAPMSISTFAASSLHGGKPSTIGIKRSREEVELEARKQGASGG